MRTVHIVRELVGELGDELTEHRRSAIAVAAAALALVLAVGVASLLGSYVAVALFAVLGMVGTGVAVLVLTARNAQGPRR
jgi:phage-related minor tail protein